MLADSESYMQAVFPAQDPQGKPIIAGLVKRTYEMTPDGRCHPAAEQDPLVGVDVYFDGKDPVTGTCYKESDIIPFKVATDVVVIGKAYAPGGRPVRVTDASVSIGSVTKRILVVGDRKCGYSMMQGPVFPEPKPFTEMEVRYERAYGGVDVASQGPDAPSIYPRNPLGRGFVVKNKKEAIEGLDLPNFEDPGMILTQENLVTNGMENWQKQPMPQGFGWYGKLWYPRCSFAGVLPADMKLYEELHEASVGAVPKDQVEQFKKFKMPMLDFKYFSGASPGLAVPYLKGNEVIRLTNLDPRGVCEIHLPGTTPKIGIDIGEGVKNPEVFLHTVCILKEENRMYLVWRGAIPYAGPEKLDSLKKMELLIGE